MVLHDMIMVVGESRGKCHLASPLVCHHIDLWNCRKFYLYVDTKKGLFRYLTTAANNNISLLIYSFIGTINSRYLFPPLLSPTIR